MPVRPSSSPTELPWSGRRGGGPFPLPERVAGSDLIFALSELAARRGYRVFFAGGGTGGGRGGGAAAFARYPGLQVVGTAAPSFRRPRRR